MDSTIRNLDTEAQQQGQRANTIEDWRLGMFFKLRGSLVLTHESRG